VRYFTFLLQWPFVNIYTCAMIGQHAQNIVADAYLLGVRQFEVMPLYLELKKAAMITEKKCSRADMLEYNEKGDFAEGFTFFFFFFSFFSLPGYISVESSNRGTCLTLAYAHNDYAIAAFARALNLTKDAEFFQNRSQNYLNVWNDDEKYFCPRKANGDFDCPIDKLNVFSKTFVEGDAEHYRFYGTNPLETFKSSELLTSKLNDFLTLGRLGNFLLFAISCFFFCFFF
jgi:putative alpha-1,2-mannosidase